MAAEPRRSTSQRCDCVDVPNRCAYADSPPVIRLSPPEPEGSRQLAGGTRGPDDRNHREHRLQSREVLGIRRKQGQPVTRRCSRDHQVRTSATWTATDGIDLSAEQAEYASGSGVVGQSLTEFRLDPLQYGDSVGSLDDVIGRVRPMGQLTQRDSRDSRLHREISDIEQAESCDDARVQHTPVVAAHSSTGHGSSASSSSTIASRSRRNSSVSSAGTPTNDC